MGAPETLILILMAYAVAKHFYHDGEPVPGHYHAGRVALAAAVELGLLYWGGFFAHFGPAQALFAVVAVLSWGHAMTRHGLRRDTRYSAAAATLSGAVLLGLYWWGGLFA